MIRAVVLFAQIHLLFTITHLITHIRLFSCLGGGEGKDCGLGIDFSLWETKRLVV